MTHLWTASGSLALNWTASAPLALNPLDPHDLLATFGIAGIFVILFAETGLLIGFFLPGDSLLFTAGLVAATSATSALHLSLPLVLIASAFGALIGAQVGYVIGRRAGPALLDRADRPKLQGAVRRAHDVLEKYGYAKAIVIARFIPIVRTVLNPLAGAVGVPARTFALWQVIGGLLWSQGVTIAGYALGSQIPGIDRYLLPIIAIVLVLSVIPMGLEVLRSTRERRGPTERSRTR